MKPIQIIAVDDERTQIPFSVPIKGRKPLEFTLPKFNFIPEDQFDELNEQIAELGQKGLGLRKYTREIALTMIKEFVSPAVYKAMAEKVITGQLDQILEVWRERSDVGLGESEASEASSTESTEAPSDTTSKPDSESSEGTSDTESDGTTSETS